ncbi:MAG: MFS transporter [Chloroflexi bacterium]|nr:MAG: MFS transporter [Chloroflexota bacterium]
MKLWTGFTIARVGSQITVLALPLTAVLLLGAGATETGLLVAAQMAPSIVAGLFIGVWVDRLPRRPIMIVSDVGSAIVIATVPLAAALGTLSLAQLYVVSFLGGAFAVATDLARAAFVPSLVGRTRLVAANSRLQASNAVAQGAGPSLGGIRVQALTAPIAMLWDAVGFLVSAVFIAAIRSAETPRPRESIRSVWHEVTEGLRWVREQPIVLRSITAIALANIEWFAVQGVLVVYATRELGLSPALLGISLAMIGPLSLLGAALAGPLTARWGLGPTMIAALFLETLSRLLLPFAGGTSSLPYADISTQCRNPRLRSRPRKRKLRRWHRSSAPIYARRAITVRTHRTAARSASPREIPGCTSGSASSAVTSDAATTRRTSTRRSTIARRRIR